METAGWSYRAMHLSGCLLCNCYELHSRSMYTYRFQVRKLHRQGSSCSISCQASLVVICTPRVRRLHIATELQTLSLPPKRARKPLLRDRKFFRDGRNVGSPAIPSLFLVFKVPTPTPKQPGMPPHQLSAQPQRVRSATQRRLQSFVCSKMHRTTISPSSASLPLTLLCSLPCSYNCFMIGGVRKRVSLFGPWHGCTVVRRGALSSWTYGWIHSCSTDPSSYITHEYKAYKWREEAPITE